MKYLTIIPQNDQGNLKKKKKERKKNYHSQEDSKETEKPHVIWCPVWDSGTEKEY